MTRRVALVAALGLSATLVARADSLPGQAKPVTLTGCLRTGSATTVYILRGAADAPVESDRRASPEDYLVATVPDNVRLADHVNHRIEVSAIVSSPSDPPPPPPGANAAERALKRLSVRSLKEVAPNCAEGR
jgi:hypothetical protein